jgi:hypothetical protein
MGSRQVWLRTADVAELECTNAWVSKLRDEAARAPFSASDGLLIDLTRTADLTTTQLALISVVRWWVSSLGIQRTAVIVDTRHVLNNSRQFLSDDAGTRYFWAADGRAWKNAAMAWVNEGVEPDHPVGDPGRVSIR